MTIQVAKVGVTLPNDNEQIVVRRGRECLAEGAPWEKTDIDSNPWHQVMISNDQGTVADGAISFVEDQVKEVGVKWLSTRFPATIVLP